MSVDSNAQRPTASMVRRYYQSNGYEVRIDKRGHVEYRPADTADSGPWLEGRWLSEYRIVEGMIVLP